MLPNIKYHQASKQIFIFFDVLTFILHKSTSFNIKLKDTHKKDTSCET